MLTVAKSRSLPAELAIYPVEADQQPTLIDALTEYVTTFLKPQPGFIGAALHKSRDGQRVVSYVQWNEQEAYTACINNSDVPSPSEHLTQFPAPNARLYEVFISEPAGSEMTIATGTPNLVNFGIFKLRNPRDQPRFLAATEAAVELVKGQPGLITTHFHRSYDGAMAVNYGLWSSHDDYVAMNANPPFAGPLLEMKRLADNEFQMSLYEIVFAESVV